MPSYHLTFSNIGRESNPPLSSPSNPRGGTAFVGSLLLSLVDAMSWLKNEVRKDMRLGNIIILSDSLRQIVRRATPKFHSLHPSSVCFTYQSYNAWGPLAQSALLLWRSAPQLWRIYPQIVPSDLSVLRLLSQMVCDEPSEAHCSTMTLCLTQAMLCVS